MADEMAGPGNGRVVRPDPDPTILTTQLIDRAVAAFREVMETRLTGMDRATDLVAQELKAFRAEADVVQQRQMEATARQIAALAELIDARLAGMDKATELLAGRSSLETGKSVNALRELLSVRIDGMDIATKLLADNVSVIPQSIEKSAAGLERIIETRLAGMDEATKLLASNVDKVPYAILQEAGNLKAFIMSRIEDVSHTSDEKFKAVDALFASNALALTAALAAQEKAVAEQNKSNTLAITKSEVSTKETIAANAAQTQTGLRGLEQTFADLKERVVRIESAGVGAASVTGTPFDAATFRQTEAAETAARSRQAVASVIAGISAVIAIIAVIYSVVHK